MGRLHEGPGTLTYPPPAPCLHASPLRESCCAVVMGGSVEACCAVVMGGSVEACWLLKGRAGDGMELFHQSCQASHLFTQVVLLGDLKESKTGCLN